MAKMRRGIELIFAIFFLATTAVQPLRSLTRDRYEWMQSGLLASPHVFRRWSMFVLAPRELIEPYVILKDGRELHAKQLARWPAVGYEQVRLISWFTFSSKREQLWQFYCGLYPDIAQLKLKIWRLQSQDGVAYQIYEHIGQQVFACLPTP